MSAVILDTVTMPASPATVSPSSRARLAGRILSGLAVAFLIVDLSFKFFVSPETVKATTDLGWPEHHFVTLGIIELVCLVLYLIPRTAPLGAILWTGYLGGAIATHLRIDNPLFSHTLFPIYIAALIWGGLYLRDARVRLLTRGELKTR